LVFPKIYGMTKKGYKFSGLCFRCWIIGVNIDMAQYMASEKRPYRSKREAAELINKYKVGIP
jgi:hypothetical protein